jgi:uncharacterized membrane protein YoaK (UPF0700 family)
MPSSAAAPGARERREREKAWMAIVLAWTAAFVDAVGFLTLFGLFTAHMSGDTSHAGMALGGSRWDRLLFYIVPIPLFVLGAGLGSALRELATRRDARSPRALLLALEAALLVGLLAFGSAHLRASSLRLAAGWQFYVLVALAAVPMGIQTSSLQNVRGRSVRTTYITGMISDLAEEAVAYLFWLRDHLRGRGPARAGDVLRASLRERSLHRALLLAAVWAAYMLGAAAAVVAEGRWRFAALALPIGALAVLVVVELAWPTSEPPHASWQQPHEQAQFPS